MQIRTTFKFMLSMALLALVCACCATPAAFAGNQNCNWTTGCAYDCGGGDCASCHNAGRTEVVQCPSGATGVTCTGFCVDVRGTTGEGRPGHRTLSPSAIDELIRRMPPSIESMRELNSNGMDLKQSLTMLSVISSFVAPVHPPMVFDLIASHRTKQFKEHMAKKGYKLDASGHPLVTLAVDKYR